MNAVGLHLSESGQRVRTDDFCLGHGGKYYRRKGRGARVIGGSMMSSHLAPLIPQVVPRLLAKFCINQTVAGPADRSVPQGDDAIAVVDHPLVAPLEGVAGPRAGRDDIDARGFRQKRGLDQMQCAMSALQVLDIFRSSRLKF